MGEQHYINELRDIMRCVKSGTMDGKAANAEVWKLSEDARAHGVDAGQWNAFVDRARKRA